MIFSKSFGYALRGILFVAMKSNSHPVPLIEISANLGVPRPFMGKIMKRMVLQKILASQKGPYGGFKLNEGTLLRPLIDVYKVTDREDILNDCVLIGGECNARNPCHLHHLVLALKLPMNKILYDTTIGDLLKVNNRRLLRGITKLRRR